MMNIKLALNALALLGPTFFAINQHVEKKQLSNELRIAKMEAAIEIRNLSDHVQQLQDHVLQLENRSVFDGCVTAVYGRMTDFFKSSSTSTSSNTNNNQDNNHGDDVTSSTDTTNSIPPLAKERKEDLLPVPPPPPPYPPTKRPKPSGSSGPPTRKPWRSTTNTAAEAPTADVWPFRNLPTYEYQTKCTKSGCKRVKVPLDWPTDTARGVIDNVNAATTTTRTTGSYTQWVEKMKHRAFLCGLVMAPVLLAAWLYINCCRHCESSGCHPANGNNSSRFHLDLLRIPIARSCAIGKRGEEERVKPCSAFRAGCDLPHVRTKDYFEM
jgi:hypothetical protein